MFEETIIIGIIVAFFYYEIVGIFPGGIIIPGYLAFYLPGQPARVVMTVFLAFISYLLVRFIISRYLILYGVRRFFLLIMVNYVLGLMVSSYLGYFPLDISLTPVGFLIGGIIANNFIRQGFIMTLANMLAAVLLIRLILMGLNIA